MVGFGCVYGSSICGRAPFTTYYHTPNQKSFVDQSINHTYVELLYVCMYGYVL